MREQRLALKELRGLQDEVILPADKRNTTIPMRRFLTTRKGWMWTYTNAKLEGDLIATHQVGELSHPLGFTAFLKLKSHLDPLSHA